VEGTHSRVEDTRREVEEVAERDKELCVERARWLNYARIKLEDASSSYAEGRLTIAVRELAAAEMWARQAVMTGSPVGEWVLEEIRVIHRKMEERKPPLDIDDYVGKISNRIFMEMLDDYCTCLEEVARARRR